MTGIAHRRADGGEDARGPLDVAHQGGARLPAGDGLGRAAHIDVDDVGAVRLGQTRGLRHRIGTATGELDHMGIDTAPLGPQARLLRPTGEFGGGDHFRDDGACTQTPRDATHVQVGDARQGGEQDRHRSRGACPLAGLPLAIARAQNAQIIISFHCAQQIDNRRGDASVLRDLISGYAPLKRQTTPAIHATLN